MASFVASIPFSLAFYLAFFLPYVLAYVLACYLAFYLTFYLAYRRRFVVVEVRRGTLWSGAGGWGPTGITLILSLLFGSGGEHCDLALAVEVRRGRRRRRRRDSWHKSNNPQLTGGEKHELHTSSAACKPSLPASSMRAMSASWMQICERPHVHIWVWPNNGVYPEGKIRQIGETVVPCGPQSACLWYLDILCGLPRFAKLPMSLPPVSAGQPASPRRP